MESKQLSTRALLQRVVTLTKHAHELQSSTNLSFPLLTSTNWHQQLSLNSDITQANVPIQTPRNATNRSLSPIQKFDFSRVQRAIQSELDRRCSRIPRYLEYESKQCSDLARDLTQQLRNMIKSELLNNNRYKLVVIVSIVQLIPNRYKHQSISIVSRCLWNYETDGSITAEAKLGRDMMAIAIAFAVYTD